MCIRDRILKDWHLAVYVAVLVAIDVILLSTVTAIPEARSVGKLVVDQEQLPFRDVSSFGKVSHWYSIIGSTYLPYAYTCN